MNIVKAKEYEIHSDKSSVIAYADNRLVFEPKNWQKLFKKDLRNALFNLEAGDDSSLVTEYDSKIQGYYDLENVLLYNVGASAFRNTAKFELRFGKGFSVFDESLKNIYPHRYSYKVFNASMVDEPWWKDNLSISWNMVSVRGFRGDKKPFDYWIALKQNLEDINIIHTIPQDSEFAIEVKLFLPKEETINIASVIKSLLDGIICAFHSPNELMCENVAEICNRLGTSSSYILNNTCTVLGQENYAQIYRDGVKWNPQDHRCTAARVFVEYTDKHDYGFSGGIYQLYT